MVPHRVHRSADTVPDRYYSNCIANSIHSGPFSAHGGCRKGDKCFCAPVELEISGPPEGMAYCHGCRSWSGGSVNAYSLWKPEAVRITAGAENLDTFQETETSQRQYCNKCGGHLMTNHPPIGLVDGFAAAILDLAFAPAVQVKYAETVLPMLKNRKQPTAFPYEISQIFSNN